LVVLAADSLRTLSVSITRSSNDNTTNCCCSLPPQLITLPPRLSTLAGT